MYSVVRASDSAAANATAAAVTSAIAATYITTAMLLPLPTASALTAGTTSSLHYKRNLTLNNYCTL
jgi:hypothetical protein